MNLKQILKDLKQERERLDKAIDALELLAQPEEATAAPIKAVQRQTLPTPYKCPNCGQGYARKKRMETHREKCARRSDKPHRENGGGVQCIDCGDRYPTVAMLDKHRNREHVPDVERLPCRSCRSTFANEAALEKHLLKHHFTETGGNGSMQVAELVSE